MRAHNYKSKAAKEIDNYMTSSNLISDSFYTTETNDTRHEYGYGRGFNKYDDDDDYYKYFKRFGERKSIDTFTNVEDFTSSSDDEKYTSNNSPRSKSEKIYSRRYSNSQTRQRRKNQSPREYETQEEGKRRSRPKYRYRNRLESASEQTLGNRSRRSPKTNYQYNIEEDLIFKKYFEPAEKRVTERRLEHSKRERRIQDGDEREFKDRKERVEKSHKQNREYQVYAYENAKPRNNVFMENTTNTGNAGLSSEIELKTHEYPVLAFKDKMTTISRDSEMVYVPVFFMDKTNKKNNQNASPVNPKPIHQENNYQVYAANLENRNYFEKMGEAFKGSLPGSHKRENSIETRKIPNKYPIFNTESKYIESILNKTEYNFKQNDSNFSPNSGTLKVQPHLPRETSKFSKETTEAKKNPFGNYQQSIVYKVKIDAETAMEKQSNQWSQKSPKQDDLHDDDYPVNKDYIKVNGSEERKPSNVAENPESIVKLIRQSIKVNGSKDRKPSNVAEKSESIIKPTRQSTKSESRNPSVFVDIITDEKISNSISDIKDSARHKSIVKDSLPTRNQSIPEENPPEKILGVGKQNTPKGNLKRSIVEAKSGSLSIPFNSLKEDMTEIRKTQGLTRLSSNMNEPEKQGFVRQSTKEHYFENQPNIIRLSSKLTVPQKSSVAKLVKQPSIFTAQESGTLEKKLSSTKSRFSQVKPQSLSSNPIPETVLETRKSAVQPATSIPNIQTQPSVPVTLTPIELRQSMMETQKTSEDSPSDQRKSQFLPEPKVPSSTPQTTQQNLASQEALREVTNVTLDMDYKREPSQTKASLSKNAEFEPTRISEVRQPTLHDEQTEEVLRKLQVLNEINREKALSEEKLTSVVNFSQNLENVPSPARGSLQNAPTYEETIRPADVRTSIKSSPLTEDFGDVAKLVDQRSEPRRSEVKKSKLTVDQPPIKKSDSGYKPKKLVSRIFKRQSQSKSDVKATPSKSLIGKRSKQSFAKDEKQTKKAPSKSFLGILKRSRSNISKQSRNSTKEEEPSEKKKEEVPSEQKKEEAWQQGTTISKNDAERATVASTKPTEAKLEEPKPCECATECVYMIAECGHFFLGTTLHEQIMKILKII